MRTMMLVTALTLSGLLPAGVTAATVKITQSNGVCHTFTDVPCCADWSLGQGSTCKDDCVVAIALGTNVPPTDVIVNLIDGGGNIVDSLNNDTGLYEFVGLSQADYTVSIDSTTVGGFLGSFEVFDTDTVSFALYIPEPTTLLLLGIPLLGMCTRKQQP
ncbi:PEP-CTERM sorting domain-containing protein [Mucisphaera sp.]|uniref:PEP-CTERM sorting domain-containing protein n=1 Tax=Mucisphaera sp. TaxID=2913024 RepID=UPI003D121227